MTVSTETNPAAGIYVDFTPVTAEDADLCTLCRMRPGALDVDYNHQLDNGHDERHHTVCTVCAEHYAFAFTLDLDAHLKGLDRYRDENDVREADERADGLDVALAAYQRMRASCVPLLAALGYSPEQIKEAALSMTGFVTRTEMTGVRTD